MKQEVWPNYRMNDYVGSGIYATLIWPTSCTAQSHLYGHLSCACVRCGAKPTVHYHNARS